MPQANSPIEPQMIHQRPHVTCATNRWSDSARSREDPVAVVTAIVESDHLIALNEVHHFVAPVLAPTGQSVAEKPNGFPSPRTS